jgi:hypothetical protein
MLASLGLRWWQHIIVRGLHEHCIAVEVIGSTKTILTPRIQLCPSDPTLPFKLSRRTFPIKISFAMTTSEADSKMLKLVGIYPLSPVFSHGQLYMSFSLFSSFENVAATITERHRGRTENDRFISSDILYREAGAHSEFFLARG